MDRPQTFIQKKKPQIFRWIKIVILLVCGLVLAGSIKKNYQEPPKQSNNNNVIDREWASRSYGLAPYPNSWEGPVVQIFSARTRGAKGALAVHTWIATKREGADHYIISQVVGWRLNRRGTALFTEPGIPDRGWAGNPPTLLLDLRDAEAATIIDDIDRAIENYPWATEYDVWPGPNSNTFIAWLGLQIPELHLDLPSTAIGKDWRPLEKTFGPSVSGTGLQASFFGLLGTSVGYEEGLEINIPGLSIELDIFDLAIELPGIGRIGPAQTNRK